VRQAFAWFAEEGKSIGWIAREPTRLGAPKGHKSTTAGWHYQQVHRMLENPKYVGIWPWGAARALPDSQGETKQVPVPPGQCVSGSARGCGLSTRRSGTGRNGGWAS
jgi:hypothetical protein